MLNEHEIRDRETIAVLEFLIITRRLTDAHSNLLMRHFSEARECLIEVRSRIGPLLDVIPKEEKK